MINYVVKKKKYKKLYCTENGLQRKEDKNEMYKNEKLRTRK